MRTPLDILVAIIYFIIFMVLFVILGISYTFVVAYILFSELVTYIRHKFK